MSFRPDSILLDKGVVRRIYEARVRAALGTPPTPLQSKTTAISDGDFLAQLERQGLKKFVAGLRNIGAEI